MLHCHDGKADCSDVLYIFSVRMSVYHVAERVSLWVDKPQYCDPFLVNPPITIVPRANLYQLFELNTKCM